MSQLQIIIPNLRNYIKTNEQDLKFRKRSAIEAFPSLTGIGKLAKLTVPTATLQVLIRWLWFQWHAGASQKSIAPDCITVIRRSLEAAKQAADDPMRPQHDVFVLIAAVLSGERALAEEAADASISANYRSKSNQFLHAWAGIMKYRLLKQSDEELQQFMVLKRSRGKGMFSEPTLAMVEAFCSRNYAAFNKEIAKAVQKCQAECEKMGALCNNRFYLSQDNRVYCVKWPWHAAAFAKLAYSEAPDLPALDSFWLPAGFIDWGNFKGSAVSSP